VGAKVQLSVALCPLAGRVISGAFRGQVFSSPGLKSSRKLSQAIRCRLGVHTNLSLVGRVPARAAGASCVIRPPGPLAELVDVRCR
jgi:hypothetical protein